MRANFIKRLCESEIKSTELALATSSISSDLQSMIEKLSNIKIKDVAELTKKIKYDGNINAGEDFNQNIGAKLDQAIQSLTEIKSEIDNEVVKISNGESLGSEDGESSDMSDSDFAKDFGDSDDEDFDEFNPDDEGDSAMDLDALNDELDNAEEIDRKAK